jgi:hypothetical protein
VFLDPALSRRTNMANVGDIYIAQVVTYSADQIAINVLWYSVTAKAGTGATDQQLCNQISTNIHAEYKACMGVGASYRGVRLGRFSPTPAPLPVQTSFDDGPGTVAGDLLPRQVSGVMTKRTALAGKRFRGRFYTAFPAEASNDVTGIPTAAYNTAHVNLSNKLDLTVTAGVAGNTNSMIPVVHSGIAAANTPVTIFDPRTKWATQRRRGSFGRPNVLPF